METGRCDKPVAVPFNDRTYGTGINHLEDDFLFLLKKIHMLNRIIGTTEYDNIN